MPGARGDLIQMSEDDLVAGISVRYNETSSRWFVGVLRKIFPTECELEYLDGTVERVSIGKVESFAAYLRSRGRVLSLTRKDLSYVFYAQALERMRSSRANKIKHFLRSHGLQFHPEEWTVNERIQIWPDDSYVKTGSSATDAELKLLIPKWLEPQRLPAGSRDPLGFQNHAEQIANELLPGLTVFTTRIAYYGFIAWAVQKLGQSNRIPGGGQAEQFHRLERAYVLCEFIHHGNTTDDCRVLGQRSKSEVLQSAMSNRFRPPAKILRNQESAGALRLYSNSMKSMGFAEQHSNRVIDGLLALTLTDLGQRLAREFEKALPEDFFDFAISEKALSREILRGWGKQLCMSKFGLAKFRRPFLAGFLLGNSQAAQSRYQTVSLLFKEGLLGGGAKQKKELGLDTLSEEFAILAEEEPESGGITNADILLKFYEDVPTPNAAILQRAAVYELLSLAHSSIFKCALDGIATPGQCRISDLRDAIVTTKHFGKFWRTPFGKHANLPTIRSLHKALFEAETSAEMAAIGGVLLRRIQTDAAFLTSATDLQTAPPFILMRGIPPERPLAESFRDLIEAMVVRHEEVSSNKSRQRWCYLDKPAQQLIRDDNRPLGIGWHAMRFPQLFSLCRDLRLTKADLSHGG
ncbi:hypothetical protein [Bradyrhizobium sp. JYMT SZCCT0180]|uniref:hypothetical protein n=1 Tax=Bradyrhizobium sp. JYMT SZCCT0180 TaxID=2807666 RepID=UPI001BAC1230|nr:hypothetical protein [Bradyrhizobium sp. JYMT SZCCT0180]MBR1214622.1 hypothetical protein [Bradyrhizobium sp. JYMT SZCCT0180]